MMKYRIQLNTETQMFLVIDRNNQHHSGQGSTIEDAMTDFYSDDDGHIISPPLALQWWAYYFIFTELKNT
ncbi:hypothetical protein [Lactiplantibacillus plantarum]|uniref:hypothetical protein n=2 Tax=Lactiplantibacillus plantarum TaxID=1590 RepID=UPI000B1652A8|nr:hypothetical protein [Lactiplantibacillus plantarum]MCG0680268.1 hypothetical protein [Lactiplantibacillus plantarum]UVW04635.1 hypothetical protein NX849_07930 [Lactiplantibacillus plantarum]UWF34807.1 hypothetical protein NYR24_07920 [Lactiplantibacillus plantarum]CAB1719593.1 hypothetical protein LAP9491_00451 [Lactiplantibacillus plantarum]